MHTAWSWVRIYRCESCNELNVNNFPRVRPYNFISLLLVQQLIRMTWKGIDKKNVEPDGNMLVSCRLFEPSRWSYYSRYCDNLCYILSQWNDYIEGNETRKVTAFLFCKYQVLITVKNKTFCIFRQISFETRHQKLKELLLKAPPWCFAN